MTEPSRCRWDRTTQTHLNREHLPDCTSAICPGCRPCTTDDHGNPVRHCRVRLRCTSHLGWTEHACPTCLSKIRANLIGLLEMLALMPAEAEQQGINSEAANLAGPHADYVTAQWRLINADRAGETVEELDMDDPYTCLTMHERTIREGLGHDTETLVSTTISAACGYLAWVLTDLARDETHVPTLTALLADTARLKATVETAAALRKMPERGAPCPECVANGAPAERLARVYGHWCTKVGCTRLHYLDDTGDVWRCQTNPEHEWTHDAYTRWIEERRGARHARC